VTKSYTVIGRWRLAFRRLFWVTAVDAFVIVYETASAKARRSEMDTRDTAERGTDTKHGQGPKYFVNIEGVEHPWPTETITTEEIAHLGGWDPSIGVIEIDQDNNERTLKPGEVVQIKPGQGFSKKIRWKRG
jgi:hypothetical protein